MRGPPDLLYEADIPVEASSASSIFLHRLIGACEPERWCIVETNLNAGRGAARLAGPVWLKRRRRGLRLFAWRGGWIWAAFLAYRSWFFPPRWLGPKPRAVYTVAFGLSWIGVVARARREGVRCVVHCHDHPASAFPSGPSAWRAVAGLIQRALAAADVCLAVSPTGEEWLKKMDVEKTAIVYSVWQDDAPPTLPSRTMQFILGYAGSIVDRGYRHGLIAASHAAHEAGWRMVVFPSSPVDAELRAAVSPVVEWQNTVPAAELPRRLAAVADAVFITTDFDPAKRDWVQVACPAKLADYAYAGLPIIAVVPHWSSLARIGTEHPDLLTVVPTQDSAALISALRRHDHRSESAQASARQAAHEVVGLRRNVGILRQALNLPSI
jgi:Glycosyltransferase Family 4